MKVKEAAPSLGCFGKCKQFAMVGGQVMCGKSEART